MSIHNTKLFSRFLALIAKLGLLFFLISPATAYSQERALAIMSGDGKIYSNFYLTLKNKLHKNIQLSSINSSEITNEIISHYDFIIPVGYKAANTISKYKTKKPIVYTLIPNNETSDNSVSCKESTCYKVYINQPVERYLKLFKILFKKNKRLVLATTEDESKYSKKIKTASKSIGFSYKTLKVQKDKNITRTFIDNLNSNDVLLALPDAQIYNKHNAKSIILSTYHANVPIIAYSKSFAKAGALISLYSSIDNIAEKTVNTINALIINGANKQKEYYPDKFTISINTTVARSLNIVIESEDAIKRKLK